MDIEKLLKGKWMLLGLLPPLELQYSPSDYTMHLKLKIWNSFSAESNTKLDNKIVIFYLRDRSNQKPLTL